MPKKNDVTSIRLKHIETDIKEIKGSLKEQTKLLEIVARQDERIKDTDLRLQINEKRVEKLQSRTMDRMWNAITIFFSVILSAVVGFFIGRK